MTTSLKRVAAASLFALAALTVHASGIEPLEKAKKEGIVLGFANEAPYAYTTPKGDLVGVDADILRAVLKRLGVTNIDTKLVEWGALIPGVRAKRFDVVASGIYMKSERCKQVSFTQPMYVLGDGMIVLAGNPKKITGFETFVADRTLKLANTIGATGPGDHALGMGVLPEQIVEVPDPPAQIAALKAGRVDAALNTGLQTEELVLAAKDPSIERASPFRQPIIKGAPAASMPGIAFGPESKDFAAMFDEEFIKLRGSPEYLEILAEYKLGKDDLPTTEMTTASICGPSS